MRFLIVSASMGGGHDGAARELRTRLRAEGNEATMVDFLNAMPAGAGTFVRLSYKWELKWSPWLYELTYRLWYLAPSMAGPLVTLIGLITNRRMRRWCAETQPDAIVSTYPLASLVLGNERLKGRLKVPVATFITDFAVHPLWTHPGVDEHFCVHPQAAAQAAKQAKGPASAPGPLVPDRFSTALPPRAAAREHLGIAQDERVVLLVAGSWGVGDIAGTFDDVLATGRYTPLAICGNNERLRRKLERRGAGRVMGWTDEMPILMAAADVLVQNAGGLSCMEAFAAGLPVVSYRPIAGHGRENAADMERAGVAAYIRKAGQLGADLDRVTGPDRERLTTAAHAMFAGDAAADTVRLATEPLPERVPVLVPAAQAKSPHRRRLAAAVAASLAMVYGGLTFGVGVATARGVGVTKAPADADSNAAYVAVRLGPGSIEDPALPQLLAADHVTAVVDGSLATEHPDALRRLTDAGVDVANGGWGRHTNMQWRRARADLRRASDAIHSATGQNVHVFLPVRRVDGFDLAWARVVHERVVVPSKVLTDAFPTSVKPGAIYVLNGRHADGPATERMVEDINSRLTSAHVAPASLAALG
ncbi:MAG: polysaccharide deacetylase family protein [Actinomycetota bacterium]|nr:polysaccharide deacetylase family protein [Actinomycetota bacterium]